MGAELGRPALRVFPSLDRASRALSARALAAAGEAIARRGRFHLVLSGGSTPRGLYESWGEGSPFPWRETEVYFGDERAVSPRSPQSNYAMARAAFLSRVPIPRGQVHRLRGELAPLSRAAREYESLLREGAGPGPRFDLVLLGIGKDGHCASLFPGAPSLSERKRWAVPVRRAGQPPFVPRLTLTLPALASSREVCFLVAGADKAPAVQGIFSSAPRGTRRFPASLVRSAGPVRWFLDREAASGLPRGQAYPVGRTRKSRPSQRSAPGQKNVKTMGSFRSAGTGRST